MALKSPFQPPIEPMLAKLTPEIPDVPGWLFEPKWDGFRALVWYDGSEVYIQSRDLKPLGRYFPELNSGIATALPRPLVLDGEVVIMTDHGLDWDALSQRIHPAESRINKLAAETPASFVAFDLLADGAEDLRTSPFAGRRARLESALGDVAPPVHITPATADRTLAADWFDRFEGAGLDGVIAKRNDDVYRPGERAMLKIKHLRTVDCVIGGFRWNKGGENESVGSLLLGLYDDDGVLHHVGHTSSFKAAEKRELVAALAPYRSEDESIGFGHGRTPGAVSRWSSGKDSSWERLRPELVVEVTFDYLQGNRFRHAATFRRWRPDKAPAGCRFDQIVSTVPFELTQVFAG